MKKKPAKINEPELSGDRQTRKKRGSDIYLKQALHDVHYKHKPWTIGILLRMPIERAT